MELKALFKFGKTPPNSVIIDTTSGSSHFRELSPFILGPICIGNTIASNFENLWQYSKVYQQHVGKTSEPTDKWFEWHQEGLADKYAHRYPMGKGTIPLYSYWFGEHLDYITARKRIYAPIYAEYVQKTQAYENLLLQYNECCRTDTNLILLDYDAYDHKALGMTLKEVINNPYRKCGHAFILLMILKFELLECLK